MHTICWMCVSHSLRIHDSRWSPWKHRAGSAQKHDATQSNGRERESGAPALKNPPFLSSPTLMVVVRSPKEGPAWTHRFHSRVRHAHPHGRGQLHHTIEAALNQCWFHPLRCHCPSAHKTRPTGFRATALARRGGAQVRLQGLVAIVLPPAKAPSP